MHPDLVSTPGPRAQLQQRHPTVRFCPCVKHKPVFNAPLGDRFSRRVKKMNTRHPFPIRAVAADRPVNNPLLRFHLATNQSEVFFLYSAILELRQETLQCERVLRNDHDAGRVLVQTMNDSGSALAADSLQVRTVVQKRIDQRSGEPTRGRMNHDPWGFINREAIRIFVENLERQRFGHELRWMRWPWLNLDAIIKPYSRARFCRRAI